MLESRRQRTAHRADVESGLLSSPLAGEDGRDSGQEGGAPKAPCRAKLRRWHRKTHVPCAKTLRRPRSGCGRSYGSAKSATVVFADRSPSIPTSRISCAFRIASSSRWMVVNTPVRPNRIENGHDGWRDRDFACCDSGTTRCLRTWRESAVRSRTHSERSAPPSPALPRKGGGSDFAQSESVSELASSLSFLTLPRAVKVSVSLLHRRPVAST